MSKKNKCFKCKKNVNLYGITCKCKNIYCYLCLDNTKHNCTYDYKEEAQNKIKKEMVKIIPNKLERI